MTRRKRSAVALSTSRLIWGRSCDTIVCYGIDHSLILQNDGFFFLAALGIASRGSGHPFFL